MSKDVRDRKEIEPAERHTFWQTHVRAWERSGISQREYCRRQGLNIKLFGYWKRKFYRKTPAVNFVPVAIKPSHPFAMKSAFSLRLTGEGMSIEIGDGFNPATLRMLLDTLGPRA